MNEATKGGEAATITAMDCVWVTLRAINRIAHGDDIGAPSLTESIVIRWEGPGGEAYTRKIIYESDGDDELGASAQRARYWPVVEQVTDAGKQYSTVMDNHVHFDGDVGDGIDSPEERLSVDLVEVCTILMNGLYNVTHRVEPREI